MSDRLDSIAVDMTILSGVTHLKVMMGIIALFILLGFIRLVNAWFLEDESSSTFKIDDYYTAFEGESFDADDSDSVSVPAAVRHVGECASNCDVRKDADDRACVGFAYDRDEGTCQYYHSSEGERVAAARVTYFEKKKT